MFVQRVNGNSMGKMVENWVSQQWEGKNNGKTQRDNQVVMFFILDLYRFINWNKVCGVKSPGKSVVCSMSSGWWWLEHECYDFPFSWECHNPNWRTHIFQIYIYIYNYIYNYIYIYNPIIPHFLIDLRGWTSIHPPWIPADSSFHQPY